MGRKLDSDIIYLNLIGQPLVILNSAQAASDLLEKRSSIYSDRIGAPMVTDPALLDWSGFAGMLPYSDTWRRQRRRVTNRLNPDDVRQFDSVQQEEARLLLGRLLSASATSNLYEEVRKQFFFTLGSAMFKVTYGYRLKGDQDLFYLNALQAVHNLFDAAMMSNFLVNAFPILSYVPDWVPGTGWKHTARKWREQKNEAINAPYEWAKQQIATGNFEQSILSTLLEDDERNFSLSATDREAELKELCYVFFAAGTDTTATALVNFVAAMVSNPEAQAKAQAEIDTVIGYATRLPTLADKQQLPYLSKLTLEVLRWLPVGPTGGAKTHIWMNILAQHGYDIQKGTVMVGNLW
ncbi:O-methylsterigmatocystin oxidoreductase Short=OMST oxidoreductase [Rhizoctonia solani AG-1 IB]|uniref:O-methylsterigmatocystin oxidoreductase Short=OMST oxidoreductase n=1 Tax=Thanatephorus cucumeris (strain AG1-IB / isolate 7/3/14) TaxID=1108050 RepID=M5CAV4_THACB|nr:O-methylsterigmatocystin oxidoreductase Short=OMST oxidoreductase [Rhizoctonia solani AG-1 IB]